MFQIKSAMRPLKTCYLVFNKTILDEEDAKKLSEYGL